MKVGDLVQSKHPRIFGSGFGVIVAIRHPPSLLGGKRAPKYNVHASQTISREAPRSLLYKHANTNVDTFFQGVWIVYIST